MLSKIQSCLSGDFAVAIVINLSLAAASAAGSGIEVTELSPYGVRPGSITGRITGIDRPSDYKVATLIFISGLGFYSKPTCAQTSVPVSASGVFGPTLLTTGNVDETATQIILALLPASADVPCYTSAPGFPETLSGQALAVLVVDRPNPAQRTLQWADESWVVKANPARVGPGPNMFSDSTENVFVDPQGRLHLRIVQRSGVWEAAEIISQRSVSYGQFEFAIDGVPRLDRNAVFGAFTWADAQRVNAEIDMLEIGQFGRSDATNSQFVVQPFDLPNHLRRLSLPVGSVTRQKMNWSPSQVDFESATETGSAIDKWSFFGAVPTPASGKINFRFNFWLLDGAAPSDSGTREIVIRDFRYTPAIEAPRNPQVDRVVSGVDFRAGLSPGGILTIFGSDFSQGAFEASAVPLPETLGGARVLINDIPARLFFVSAGQINAQVPYETPAGKASLVLEIGTTRTAPFVIDIAARSPRVFQLATGHCIAQKPDGALVLPTNPLSAGDVFVLYLAGVGQIDPRIGNGQAAPRSPLSIPAGQFQADLRVGEGIAPIDFLGLTPGLVAVAQANARVPAISSSSDVDLTIAIDGARSNTCKLSVISRAILPPSLAQISPSTGPPSGGTRLILTGNNFQIGVLVRVGNQMATGVTLVSAQQITAITPAGSGTQDVTVINPTGQTATLPAAFRYIAQAPVLTQVTPPTGSTSGGTRLTINGSNFQNGSVVRIGAQFATGVTLVDSQQITASTPAGAGTQDVTVVNPDGQMSTLLGAFRYVAPAPVLTQVAPVAGPASGGTRLTLYGSNFQSGAVVRVGNQLATDVVLVRSLQITVTTPAGTGTQDVTVVNPDAQSSTLAGAFSYQAISTAPGIQFTSVPAYGTFAHLKGRVTNITDPSRYRVAVYIKVGSSWWTKPFANSPLTLVQQDLSWECNVTTGGIDQTATEFAAFLVDANYNPPIVLGGAFPSLNALASVSVQRVP